MVSGEPWPSAAQRRTASSSTATAEPSPGWSAVPIGVRPWSPRSTPSTARSTTLRRKDGEPAAAPIGDDREPKLCPDPSPEAADDGFSQFDRLSGICQRVALPVGDLVWRPVLRRLRSVGPETCSKQRRTSTPIRRRGQFEVAGQSGEGSRTSNEGAIGRCGRRGSPCRVARTDRERVPGTKRRSKSERISKSFGRLRSELKGGLW